MIKVDKIGDKMDKGFKDLGEKMDRMLSLQEKTISLQEKTLDILDKRLPKNQRG